MFIYISIFIAWCSGAHLHHFEKKQITAVFYAFRAHLSRCTQFRLFLIEFSMLYFFAMIIYGDHILDNLPIGNRACHWLETVAGCRHQDRSINLSARGSNFHVIL